MRVFPRFTNARQASCAGPQKLGGADPGMPVARQYFRAGATGGLPRPREGWGHYKALWAQSSARVRRADRTVGAEGGALILNHSRLTRAPQRPVCAVRTPGAEFQEPRKQEALISLTLLVPGLPSVRAAPLEHTPSAARPGRSSPGVPSPVRTSREALGAAPGGDRVATATFLPQHPLADRLSRSGRHRPGEAERSHACRRSVRGSPG